MIPGLGLIIVAAGSSARMEGTDKVWALLDRNTVLWHSLHALSDAAERTVVVVRSDHRERAHVELTAFEHQATIVEGGPRRQDSVARGLAHLQNMFFIAVHDAARPLARPDVIYRGVELLETWDGAVPALSVPDTVKQVDDHGGVVQTIDRTTLRAVQTPQVFRMRSLQDAHASEYAFGNSATDDAGLLESCRFRVTVFPGQEGNFKITTPYDLWLARQLVKSRCAS